MKADFSNISKDEYELMLPMPVFSQLSIDKALSPGILYQDVIRIESDTAFFCHVTADSPFIRISQEVWRGRNIAVPYSIDLRHMPEGETWQGTICFTYPGGEKLIPVKVTGTAPETDRGQAAEQGEVGGIVDSPKKPAPYTLRVSKRAYHIDETVTVFIMNHQPYPLTVLIEAADKGLKAETQILNVSDMSRLKLWKSQSWFDRHITKKHYRKPTEQHFLRLRIRHEEGETLENLPIVFSAYDTIGGDGRVRNDRDFRKILLTARRHYNTYILRNDKSQLEKTLVLTESAMNYHSTDVSLRLFYMLILCELGHKEAVSRQVNEVLQFSDYYYEDRMVEFMEILQALAKWLKGINVRSSIDLWGPTDYRQLFRLRVFNTGIVDFQHYEQLYEVGFMSTHFLAHCAAMQNESPWIPSRPSVFYRRLLTWSVNKEAIGDKWRSLLIRGTYQISTYQLIGSGAAAQLYAEAPTEAMLRILTSSLLQEQRRGRGDYSIYLEAMKAKIHIKGLEEAYVTSARINGMPIEFEYLNPMGLRRKLAREETLYLLGSYLWDDRTDKSPHLLIMRQYREMLEAFRLRQWTVEEARLIRYEIMDLMNHHQWTRLSGLYDEAALNQSGLTESELFEPMVREGTPILGYEWFTRRIPANKLTSVMNNKERENFAGWLLEHQFYDAFDRLWYGGLLTEVSSEVLEGWAARFFVENRSMGLVLGSRVLASGQSSDRFLPAFLSNARGSMAEMLTLFDRYDKEGQQSESFLESLLYRGIVIRMEPARLLMVYRRYVRFFGRDEVLTAVDRYFAAAVLIEESYGLEDLIGLFENRVSDGRYKGDGLSPIALALLKLYVVYGGEKTEISGNIVKKAMKNGIIFPWFKGLSAGDSRGGPSRKAAFFSYHAKPWKRVTLHYRYPEEEDYRTALMRHVYLGLHIGYILAFYGEEIQYYFSETDAGEARHITESGLYSHEVLAEPSGRHSTYDVVNTLVTAMEMEDEATVLTAMKEHIDYRDYINRELELME